MFKVPSAGIRSPLGADLPKGHSPENTARRVMWLPRATPSFEGCHSFPSATGLEELGQGKQAGKMQGEQFLALPLVRVPLLLLGTQTLPRAQTCCWCQCRVWLPDCCPYTQKSQKMLFWSIWAIYSVQHGSHRLRGPARAQGSPAVRGVTKGERDSQAASPQSRSARYHLRRALPPRGRTCGGWSSAGSRVWLCSVLLTVLCLIPA